jgi:hypothetical protein
LLFRTIFSINKGGTNMSTWNRGSSSVGLVLLIFVTLALAYSLAGGLESPSFTSDKQNNVSPQNTAAAAQVQQVQNTMLAMGTSLAALQSHYQTLQNQVQTQSVLSASSQNPAQLQASQQQVAQDLASIQLQYQSLQSQSSQLSSPQLQTVVQTLGQDITDALGQSQALQTQFSQLHTDPTLLQSTQTQTALQSLGQAAVSLQTQYDSIQAEVQAVAQTTASTSTAAQTSSNQIIVTQEVPGAKENLQLRTFTIITVAPTAPPIIAGLVSCNSNTSIPSIEHGVFKTFAPSIAYPGDSIKVWFADEKTPQVGVHQIRVNTPTGLVVKDYPVSPLNGVPSVAIPPLVGAGYSDPDPKWRGTDVYGIPIYPAMFITDITTDPNSTAGDWENGGTTALPPHALFGTWTTTVKNVDAAGKVTLDVGPAAPSKNVWNLGPGSDPVPPYHIGNDDTDYGAEARWDVNTLVSQGYMQSGHTYRVEFIVHDGDATKEGGDVDERCGTVRIP